jgi:hypothetical protein
MAADTLRIVTDEILTTIKQTYDDKDVSRAQAAYWTIIVANTMLGQHIAKRDSGAFLTPFYNVPVITSDGTIMPKGRKYFELPANIFDFDNDDGVEYIVYQNENDECSEELRRKTIHRTSPGELQWLELNKYTQPSPKNPYWYRASEIIRLVGIEAVPIKHVEIGIYMTIDPLEKIDIDAPFHFPQELLESLKRRVVDLARFSFLFNSQTDTVNDGSNTAESSNIPKIASVNDQNTQQQ